MLGADTEVALEGRALGKPVDRAGATDRLRRLSGRTHTVLGGLVLLSPKQRPVSRVERSGVARSEVTFRDLDPAIVEAYLASEEWRDRAGGYAIQGLGSVLVERVEGDFSNVVGLPHPPPRRARSGTFRRTRRFRSGWVIHANPQVDIEIEKLPSCCP